MITSAVAVKVGASPEVVFRFLLDPKNLERTVPSNLDIKIKRGDFSGPSALMHWTLTKKDGSKVEWTEAYTQYIENTLLKWKSSSGPLWEGSYRLQQVAGGTFLTMVETTDYFDSAKHHEQILTEQLNKTKQLIEKQ
ncbi:MAG: SRPBCC family protein [Candidatus Ranarchaeia archaeon]